MKFVVVHVGYPCEHAQNRADVDEMLLGQRCHLYEFKEFVLDKTPVGLVPIRLGQIKAL